MVVVVEDGLFGFVVGEGVEPVEVVREGFERLFVG